MKYVYDDGGRATSGFIRSAGDCVCRSIAIAAEIPYEHAYTLLKAYGQAEGRSRRNGKASNPRTGINVSRKWFKDMMKSLGFVWVPTMGIGTGCQVHLADGELPQGRLVVNVSKHCTAVIDGVIHDTYDPQREGGFVINVINGERTETTYGGRCVYGYWLFKGGV